MAIEYNLFRVKFIRPKQKSLFDDGRSPEQIFLSAINDKPSAEFKHNYFWHIGNITVFDEKSGYFAIGRTTKTTLPTYDEVDKNFNEEESNTSPFTYVIYDAKLGLIAIAKKITLSQTTISIAKVLKNLIARTHSVLINNINVEIDMIPDPTEFIDKIRTVYALKGFTASFTGPNPFDADEYFQKPLSVYLKHANGDCGKTSICGDDLDREVVVAVAKSTASTANFASAKVIVNIGERSTKINMKGDLLKLVYDDETHNILDVYTDMKQTYQNVRSDEN